MNKKERQDKYRKDLKKLSKQVEGMEEKIVDIASHLQNGDGLECDCNKCDAYEYIYYGNFREIHSVCLNCGGFVEVQDEPELRRICGSAG